MIITKSLGELLGTFILVFIGCSSVAISTLGIALLHLWQVALVWGIGVALAIYISRQFCPAHLNPAVSLASFLTKKSTLSEFLLFSLFQLLGATIAGLFVYLIFNDLIISFENFNEIIRGEQNSQRTARIFGEFYETTGNDIKDLLKAFLSELIGTFFLVLVILLIGKSRRKIGLISPLLIGLTVSLLIIWLAPISQGGFNPARDFGPRIIAYFNGWNQAAFPSIPNSFLVIYVFAPLIGSMLSTAIFTYGYRYSKIKLGK